ncbi:ComEC/Rec2 family competence protein [Croceicoccus naphthovorans]|uniref:ComEC/Rec2 family competence protein n=1 Tax=Croceicoccus naphthovorans TaxID=1348774 RepID=UPI00146FF85B|nr:ComEC/Rec2 family competence protein [Croceicoccus naphthovorans]MBB3990876.1 competence protein ComEC [Croceicoccus naphthovorans]
MRNAVAALAIAFIAGMCIIWARSELVGTPALGRPLVKQAAFRILEREDDPARNRVRLVVLAQMSSDAPVRARISVPDRFDASQLVEGATAEARLRLVPPSRALVPGAYDYARRAWFDGIAATGSVLSQPEVLITGRDKAPRSVRDRLSGRVRERMAEAGAAPSAAAIAATLLAGDRTGMTSADAQAMRDAGLSHLLSISGLHVGAVIAIVWFCAMRTLALWPWLALRVPLPLVASAVGALAGVGYTILTGAALPTVRACLAALLILVALSLGRQALSLRIIALGAIAIMSFWPEAAIGPSFQMSFAAVVAIVALHTAKPVAAYREGAQRRSWLSRTARGFVLLFLTGLVIEIALTPLVLFHFHRAGLYGAVANLVAIPLTTLAIMPLLGVAMLAEAVGLAAPFWWLAAQAIGVLLSLAREVSAAPGSVGLAPLIPAWIVVMIAAGGFWMAIWSGRLRLWGLAPVAVGLIALLTFRPPDLLVSEDGRHVALAGNDGLYLLRPDGTFARDALAEVSGHDPEELAAVSHPLSDWPDARCDENFCGLAAQDGTTILIAKGFVRPEAKSLAAACAQSDIVIAENAWPDICRPRWLKLDGRELSRRGGAALDFKSRTVRYVRPVGDRHGW